MNSIPTFFKASALAITLATTSFIAGSIAPEPAKAQTQSAVKSTVLETAANTGVHDTLVAAVKAAGLVEALSTDDDFTIFAPTDSAFAKLPDGTVANLVKPENKGTLTKILTYHVVPGRVTSGRLVNYIERLGEYSFATLSGEELTARLSGDSIVITDAKGRTTAVTTADVRTSNGIIHVTDGVFLPG